MTVDAKDVYEGSESLADVEAKLATANPDHTPVIECNEDALIEKAFAGTSLAN
jgi:hypothetical protein